MLAVQDFTRLGSRAFVCSEVYKVYSYYDFGKDIKNNDKNKIKYFFCFLGKWDSKKGARSLTSLQFFVSHLFSSLGHPNFKTECSYRSNHIVYVVPHPFQVSSPLPAWSEHECS